MVNNIENPLMKFARRPALTVKLASSPSWYPEGFIQYTINGEVEVYPMLPKDELMLLNPDALLSGQAMVNLIKSCCPSILDPGKLYYPDANILLFAIRRATYGNDYKQSHRCPKCAERMKTMTPEEIVLEEKEGTLMTHDEEHILNADEILARITPMEDEYVYNHEGLKIYLQALTLKEKEYYGLLTAQKNKLYKMYDEFSNRTEDVSEKEKNDAINKINNIQIEMNDLNVNIITSCIRKIQLPDESIIEDRDMIKEFIANSESKVIVEISEAIDKINECGIAQKAVITCSACGYEEEVPLEGYNQSDFFG